jgi:hypothetical protein
VISPLTKQTIVIHNANANLQYVCSSDLSDIIHDRGMSPDQHGANIQSVAMLWRVFTTRLDDGTYGDLIAHTNMPR